MLELAAHVVDGRIVIDEPIDLPNGAKVSVYVHDHEDDHDDDMSDLTPDERMKFEAAFRAKAEEDRQTLDARLRESMAASRRGELVDADDVFAELGIPVP